MLNFAVLPDLVCDNETLCDQECMIDNSTMMEICSCDLGYELNENGYACDGKEDID